MCAILGRSDLPEKIIKILACLWKSDFHKVAISSFFWQGC